MDKKELEQNLLIIKDELEIEVDEKIIDQVQQKLNRLCNLMGLSAECMKWAKHIVLVKQKYIFALAGKQDMGATMFKYFLEGEMAEELALFTYCDRLNAAITHACDGLRTMISLYKQELSISNFEQ